MEQGMKQVIGYVAGGFLAAAAVTGVVVAQEARQPSRQVQPAAEVSSTGATSVTTSAPSTASSPTSTSVTTAASSSPVAVASKVPAAPAPATSPAKKVTVSQQPMAEPADQTPEPSEPPVSPAPESPEPVTRVTTDSTGIIEVPLPNPPTVNPGSGPCLRPGDPGYVAGQPGSCDYVPQPAES